MIFMRGFRRVAYKTKSMLVFESYRSRLLVNVFTAIRDVMKTITRKASEGDVDFPLMIDEGHIEHYQNDIESTYGKIIRI